jgi:BirA family biotin operon repressor/biotin-[acetyl-CoA-carboxylase] ligase
MRPDCPANTAVQLGFVAALAVGSGLAALLPLLDKLSYKWPNDVLLNGRKVAGILLESETTTLDSLAFLVVGVGINLATSPQNTEFPATSIVQQGLAEIPPAVMLQAFVERFQFWERRWRECGFTPVRAAWRPVATARGEPIRIRLEAATLSGRFLDIDEEGALVLDAEGRCRHISAGEVFPAVG